MSWPAQLNILADQYAKSYLSEATLLNQQNSTASTPFTQCEVYYSNCHGQKRRVENKLLNTLRFWIHRDTARNYWIEKKQLEDNENEIDWDLRARSLRNSPRYESRWLCKFSSGFCGTGVMLKRYKYQTHDRCPRCNAIHENTNHVLLCPHTAAQELWDNGIKALLEWMLSKDISQDIAIAITTNLKKWHCMERPVDTSNGLTTLANAIRRQSTIGWNLILEGFWSKEWVQIQKSYFKAKTTPGSAELLLSKAQRRI